MITSTKILLSFREIVFKLLKRLDDGSRICVPGVPGCGKQRTDTAVTEGGIVRRRDPTMKRSVSGVKGFCRRYGILELPVIAHTSDDAVIGLVPFDQTGRVDQDRDCDLHLFLETELGNLT